MFILNIGNIRNSYQTRQSTFIFSRSTQISLEELEQSRTGPRKTILDKYMRTRAVYVYLRGSIGPLVGTLTGATEKGRIN